MWGWFHKHSFAVNANFRVYVLQVKDDEQTVLTHKTQDKRKNREGNKYWQRWREMKKRKTTQKEKLQKREPRSNEQDLPTHTLIGCCLQFLHETIKKKGRNTKGGTQAKGQKFIPRVDKRSVIHSILCPVFGCLFRWWPLISTKMKEEKGMMCVWMMHAMRKKRQNCTESSETNCQMQWREQEVKRNKREKSILPKLRGGESLVSDLPPPLETSQASFG